MLVGGESVSNRQVEPFVKALGMHDFDYYRLRIGHASSWLYQLIRDDIEK